MVDVAAADTRTLIMEAARGRLLADGYAGLSTRKVAEQAQVPVSQLHYHFGSKQGLILALFAEENQRRLDRQRGMYGEDLPLWRRYGTLGPFTAEELAALVGSAFLGSEELLLLGFDRQLLPIRSALRRVGVVLRQLEEEPAQPVRIGDARLPASP